MLYNQKLVGFLLLYPIIQLCIGNRLENWTRMAFNTPERDVRCTGTHWSASEGSPGSRGIEAGAAGVISQASGSTGDVRGTGAGISRDGVKIERVSPAWWYIGWK